LRKHFFTSQVKNTGQVSCDPGDCYNFASSNPFEQIPVPEIQIEYGHLLQELPTLYQPPSFAYAAQGYGTVGRGHEGNVRFMLFSHDNVVTSASLLWVGEE